jgi:hypothetical protein
MILLMGATLLGILPGSFDAKAVKTRNQLGFGFLDVIHAGGAWTCAQA